MNLQENRCSCEEKHHYDSCNYERCPSCCDKKEKKCCCKPYGPYSSYTCVSTKGFKGKCGGYEQKCIKKCYCDKNGCKKSKCEYESKHYGR